MVPVAWRSASLVFTARAGALPPGKDAPVPAHHGVAEKLPELGASRWQRHWPPTNMDAVINSETGRLSVQTVEHLHRLIGGDARTENMVLDYIQFRWKAKSLFGIPPKAATQIIRRPSDFLTAAKKYCEPELMF